VTEPVVEVARLGLREDFVRLDDLAEALLGVGLLRDIRVELVRLAAEGSLQRGVVGAAIDA
jgi:hypothetical protein